MDINIYRSLRVTKSKTALSVSQLQQLILLQLLLLLPLLLLLQYY